jgi:hypothetical protein
VDLWCCAHWPGRGRRRERRHRTGRSNPLRWS